ncbi:TetR/AcrR family transcriptional regulator [Nocardioides sp. AE5]|uniref:TetR/AcrR family transcriptional regulator n=1 Tax=Nocardioides sp. AE5 TaxID=2962573 RepID=UPI002881F376|nr:TetR/AcrR family transcriptional regulator [Nocardioides sp. AE5]MDT0201942.1 TetR/AcrR family transcriptional regulator [Nocardioides sp. AE5]
MPKITANSVDEHRNQVHHAIFQSLASLMNERSFDAITMAQIAAGAGIGRTAIYHHFPDKDAVVVAFASDETARYIERLEAVLADTAGPAEALRVYIRHNLDSGEQFHVGLGPKLYGLLAPESRQAIREHVVAIEDVLRSILQQGLAAGVFAYDDEAAAMAMVHAGLSARQVDPTQVEDFLLRGLSTRT